MGRKYCGKRRNQSSRAISPFPKVFSKNLCCRHVKPGHVWERVYNNVNEGFLKHGGKWRKCWLPSFSPFLTTLSKDLYCRHVKIRACRKKVCIPRRHV